MTRRITLNVSDELHRSLKLYCAYEDITLSQATTKALREFVKKHVDLIEKLGNDEDELTSHKKNRPTDNP